MDHKQQKLSRFISDKLLYSLNPRNLVKLFYKPGRIGVYLRENFNELNAIFSDIKLKPATDSQLLATEKAAVLALYELARQQDPEPLKLMGIEEVFGPGTESAPDALRLAELFRQYGSDKSTTHDYYRVYAALLRPVSASPFSILEIGLGTNNLDVPSNMGAAGKPGASLRAFRDMYPNARVYGADIDTRILFEEERIRTGFVDQTRPETFDELIGHFGEHPKFDLIIDDGLHNAEANLNTLLFALRHISPNGIVVVEDIAPGDLVYYQIVSRLLGPGFRVRFLQTRTGCMCLVYKQDRALN